VSHQEFPELTPEALAAFEAAYKAYPPGRDARKEGWVEHNRKGLAAFLREAINQAQRSAIGNYAIISALLRGIADNLHSPPPPPPTLAQAQAADLDTPEGRDVVHAFLATLGEGLQL
jgi:hypothetical protein